MNRQGREVDKRLAVGIIAVAVLTTAIGVWMERSHFSPCKKRFSSGFTNHVLAIELVLTPGDVQEIVGELGDRNRDVMRGKVQKDFFFIPSYALLFAGLGWLLGRGNSRFATWAGAAIVMCAGGAAVFDVLENLRILQVLDVRLADANEVMLDSLRLTSQIKWGFVFVAMALLSPIVFQRRELFELPFGPPRLTAVLGAVIALAYLLAAIIGLIGIMPNPLIEKAAIIMSVALFLTVLLLLTVLFPHGRGANNPGVSALISTNGMPATPLESLAPQPRQPIEGE